MSRFGLCLILSAFVSTAAAAADLAYKAPRSYAPAYAPVQPTWTGFYMGGAAGWGMADGKIRVEDTSASDQGTGFVGGGFVGFNYQINNVVLGVETDLFGTSIEKRYTDGFWSTEKYGLDYLGTVRGRLGYAIGGWMPYLSGGFAYGRAKYELSDPIDGTFKAEKSLGGWTVGAGVDIALTPNWFGRIDYRYYDLDKKTFQINGAATSLEVAGHLVTAGIGVKF